MDGFWLYLLAVLISFFVGWVSHSLWICRKCNANSDSDIIVKCKVK